MSYAVTKSRVLQYIGIILIIGVFAGAYWYFQVFAGVKTNTGAAQPQGTGRLDSGLAGYWKLDDGSGTSATDSSTNGNTGTLTNGPTWTTGQIGGAVDFDGTNDSIPVSTSGPLDIVDGENFTLSGWFNRDTFTSDHTIVAKRGSLASGNNGYAIYIPGTGDKLTFEVSDGTDEYLIESTSTFTATGWHHFSLVWDESGSSQTKLYINGAAESTTNTGTFGNVNSINNAKSFTLGMLSDGGSNFDGKLDEIRFYDRALSPDEAVSLYRLTAPTGVDTGLKGYWSFNAQDMNGTTAYDRSGAGNTGTLTNGPAKTVGIVGQALAFDGSNDYVDIADVTYNGEFTVAVWFNTSNNSQTATIFGDQAGGSGGGIKTGMTGGNFFVRPVSSSDNTIPLPTAGQWHHIVMTRDAASKIDFYVDGVGKRMFSDTAQSASFIPDKLGCNGSDGTQCFTGKLDEYRIYNRAITAADVKSLYDVGSPDKANTGAAQPQGTGRLDSGLAGYWKLDDGSGTSATDSSTNGNTGTLTNGPTWTTGQIGGAVDFDGTNDIITTSRVIPTQGSISVWVNADSSLSPSDQYTIVESQDVSGNIFFLQLNTFATYDSWEFSYRGAFGNTLDLQGPVYTSDSEIQGWHLVTGTWDSAVGGSLYVDGVLVSSSATTTGTLSSSMTLNIGDDDGGTRGEWDGRLDEVRLYDRVLSSDEVAQLYRLTAPTGVDTGLKGYWSFNAQDMPSSTTAADRSGASNTGTLTNGPTKVLGKLGQALSFDGTDDYITVADANSLDITGAISMGAWVKTSDTDSCIMSKTVVSTAKCFESTGNKVYEIGILSNTIYFQTSNGATANVLSGSASTITNNTWHYLVATWDGTTGTNGMKLYLDGVLLYQSTATVSSIQSTSSAFTFGGDSGSYDYAGLLDEARLYNRALSAAEIKGLYDLGVSDKTNSSVSQPQGTGRLDSGLAGYWPLDNGSGTSATDASTNGNTGTLTSGPTWSTGQIGGAVTFDGTDDYIQITNAVPLNPSYITVSAWVKTSATGVIDQIFSKDVTAGDRTWQFRKGTGNGVEFIVFRESDETNGTATGTTSIADNAWHHVTGTWDGVTIKVFVDGKQDGSTAFSGVLNANETNNVFIGRSENVDAGYFTGQIDEVRVYNRVLSDDEVTQLYRLNAPTGTETGLKGYWSFNGQDMSGTTAYDRSGAGNNGTLTNGPTKTIGKIGQALSFDGTDDYIDITNINFSGTFTFSTWFFTGNNAQTGIIFGEDSGSSTTTPKIGIASGSFFVRIVSGGSSDATIAVPTVSQWHHLVVTRDASDKVDIYVDGGSANRLFSDAAQAATYALDKLGLNGSEAVQYFNGKLDETRVYSRTLTAAEIIALYNQGR